MPRPHCPRRVGFLPNATYFKPAGIPLRVLEEVTVTLDELEALRLADLLGLYQEQAAAEMGISRATFARIVESARRKVADALIAGKALRLEGGPVIQPPAAAWGPPGAPGPYPVPGAEGPAAQGPGPEGPGPQIPGPEGPDPQGPPRGPGPEGAPGCGRGWRGGRGRGRGGGGRGRHGRGWED